MSNIIQISHDIGVFTKSDTEDPLKKLRELHFLRKTK